MGTHQNYLDEANEISIYVIYILLRKKKLNYLPLSGAISLVKVYILVKLLKFQIVESNGYLLGWLSMVQKNL